MERPVDDIEDPHLDSQGRDIEDRRDGIKGHDI